MNSSQFMKVDSIDCLMKFGIVLHNICVETHSNAMKGELEDKIDTGSVVGGGIPQMWAGLVLV